MMVQTIKKVYWQDFLDCSQSFSETRHTLEKGRMKHKQKANSSPGEPCSVWTNIHTVQYQLNS